MRIMFEPGSSKYCSPYCRFFRCARNFLITKERKKICTLTNEECDPKNCQFATCAINKLIITEGICELWMEKHRRRKRILDITEIEDIPDEYDIRGYREYY